MQKPTLRRSVTFLQRSIVFMCLTHYLGTLVYFLLENETSARIIFPAFSPSADMVLSLGQAGPHSVIRRMIFQGTSLVYFLGSESTLANTHYKPHL